MQLVPPTVAPPRQLLKVNVQGTLPFELKLTELQKKHYESELKKLKCVYPVVKPNCDEPRMYKQRNERKISPKPIVYPEDALRERFYADHPFELCRPQTLVGSPPQAEDYGRPLITRESCSGEDVIQLQLYLISEGMTIDEAYKAALTQFYAVRTVEEQKERRKRMKNRITALDANGLKKMYPVNYEAWIREEEALKKSVKLPRKIKLPSDF